MLAVQTTLAQSLPMTQPTPAGQRPTRRQVLDSILVKTPPPLVRDPYNPYGYQYGYGAVTAHQFLYGNPQQQHRGPKRNMHHPFENKRNPIYRNAGSKRP